MPDVRKLLNTFTLAYPWICRESENFNSEENSTLVSSNNFFSVIHLLLILNLKKYFL